jgi:hypothetical protein
LPQDFDVRRDEYYTALGQPLKGREFVEEIRRKMEVALTTFDANLPANPKVKIATTKKGQRPYLVDAVGGATRAAQHFGFDGRVSAALANDTGTMARVCTGVSERQGVTCG